MSAHGDDRHLQQAALDRGLESQNSSEFGYPPSDTRGVHKSVERADQAASLVDQAVPAGLDDAVPDPLTARVQFITTHIPEATHSETIGLIGSGAGHLLEERLLVAPTESGRTGSG
jgi:hypothetical protein